MSAQRFAAGTRFAWRNILFEVKRFILPDQTVNVEDLTSGATLLISLKELADALFRDELRFELPPSGKKTSAATTKSASDSPIDLSDYPSHLVDVARYRLKIIQPLLALTPQTRTESVVIARVKEVKQQHGTDSPHALNVSVSRASIYRWIRDYQTSGNDLRSLIPDLRARGGTGKTRLEAVVNTILESIIKEKYYQREKTNIDDLLHALALRLEEENRLRSESEKLKLPSRGTIARRVESLDMREKFEAKHGKRAAQRHFTQYGKIERPQLPLEVVEIDHTRIDLIVIDEEDNLPLGRPTLTYALDGATSFPLGYYMGFEPPSYYSLMECLYHAIRPKDNAKEKYGTEHEWLAYGLPMEVKVDNAPEFISSHFSDSCELLGIAITHCPVRTPEFKASMERHFGTLNSGLFHQLSGTTFSNIFQRGDYDSMKQACLSLSELDKALHLFIVDIYAERYQRGLQGIPARRWENLMATNFSPRLPPSQEELLILLGRVDWRSIHHYGIDFKSLRYNSSDLSSLRTRLKGEKVKIKYHPADLSRLYVFDSFERCYITVPALQQEYTNGLSLWKHEIVRHYAHIEEDRVDLAALGRAKRKIQEMVDQARSRKRTSTRSRIARWDRSDKPPSLAKNETLASLSSLLPAADSAPAPASPVSAPPRTETMITPDEADSEKGWGIVYKSDPAQGESTLSHEPR